MKPTAKTLRVLQRLPDDEVISYATSLITRRRTQKPGPHKAGCICHPCIVRKAVRAVEQMIESGAKVEQMIESGAKQQPPKPKTRKTRAA